MGPSHTSAGNQIGRYRLIREIARSNDIVYEAVDPVMGRRVAIKELYLPPNLGAQQRKERVDRFYREARAAGTLTHPNIVTIYEVGEWNGRHFIAMEYLEGISLRERLNQGPLPIAEALRIAIAIGEALDYAHRHRVIHRDVKPDNVHLLPDGRVKLTDFGIARITFEPTLTVDGQIFGTPSYMSPEQVTGKSIDARSDLFSLGVMIYEMVTGRKPFTGESVITITYNILNADLPPHPAIPFALEQLLRRAMAKHPNQRFATAREMVRAMERLRAQLRGREPAVAAPLAPPVVPPPVAVSPAPAAPPVAPVAAPAPAPADPFAGLSAADFEAEAVRPPPLLSPNARWLLGWTAVWLVVGLLIVALVCVGKMAWDSAQQNRTSAAIGQRFQRALDLYRRRQFAAARDEWLAIANQPGASSREREIAARNAAVACIELGRQFERGGDFDRAWQAYQQAVTVHPYCAQGYAAMGKLAADRGQHDQALQYYDAAIRVCAERLSLSDLPNEDRGLYVELRERATADKALVLYNYGVRLAQEGRYAEADQKFAEAIMIAPGSRAAALAKQAQAALPARGEGALPGWPGAPAGGLRGAPGGDIRGPGIHFPLF